MDPESFLARVRASLGDRSAESPRPAPYRPPEPAPHDELVERLAGELEAVGGVVHRVASPEEARDKVLQLLMERRARRVIRGATPLVEELDLDGKLDEAGVEVTVAADDAPRDTLREAAFLADAGISSVDYGIAETGTLALLARPGQGRSVSLLPPVHIAVLDAGDVVAELADLFERVTARGELPSALTFITGPSRTGDIELVLTVGVHGPKELHLVVVAQTETSIE